MTDTQRVGRRERLRAETYAEIKQAALTQVAVQGASALSVRGIARAIGMSPAGLYRYYDGLEALLTDLITDAYNELADAVSAASAQPGSLRDRLLAAMHAYRSWALAERQRFLLIFGTPLPGYAAPPNGPTEVANRRLGAVFFDLAAQARTAGLLHVSPLDRPPTPRELAAADLLGADLPPTAVTALMSAYAHLHGLVTLEVLGQLEWLYPGAQADAFFSEEANRIAEQLIS